MFSFSKSYQNREEIDRLISLMDEIILFVKREQNHIPLETNEHPSSSIEPVFQKCNELATLLEEKSREDLGVNGEILLMSEKMADGYFDDRVHLKSRDPHFQYTAQSINKMAEKIQYDFTQIIQLLGSYEEGDYTGALESNRYRGGVLKEVMKGIDGLRDSITTMLRESFSYGIALENVSRQLDEKMGTILKATRIQSESLKEATSHVTHISQKIDENRSDTEMMQHSSLKVKSSAIRGKELANETVRAMHEINEATSAITEAIEVIDQIAFQTNILSLNAAVEAATAGEAGKGFAVVASEVRNLASRSSEAAKRIKELVSQAAEKTEEGQKTSIDMIEGYHHLNTNIEETITLIEKTTQTSKKQVENIKDLERTLHGIQSKTGQFVEIAQQASHISGEIYDISHKIAKTLENKKFPGKEHLVKLSESGEISSLEYANVF
ncbi:MAG: hypothetical protein B6D59_06730 [Campylobacteraceae bacterium 4484_4]|nr:MAG: hypothetical protein B6D59_06730 [Campylobacteraceae bacterium 4484_4]